MSFPTYVSLDVQRMNPTKGRIRYNKKIEKIQEKCADQSEYLLTTIVALLPPNAKLFVKNVSNVVSFRSVMMLG